MSSERTEFPLTDHGRLVVHRASRRAIFTTEDALSDGELIHPYLAPAAAAFAHWAGREAFHAGAFVHGNRAWGLLGGRGAGKSSTLAWLAAKGYEILTDDLLITDSTIAFAGPRCVDLRRTAAQRLPFCSGLTRDRMERWRLVLGNVSGEVRLGGWVFLEWGRELSINPMPLEDRIGRLASHRSILVEPTNPRILLGAAALPAWRLTRPQVWESIDEAASRLLRLADG